MRVAGNHDLSVQAVREEGMKTDGFRAIHGYVAGHIENISIRGLTFWGIEHSGDSS